MQDNQTIVALVSMFFGAKLKGLCEASGYIYKGSIGIEGLIQRIEECNPIAILIDLGKDDIVTSDVVGAIRSKTDAPIVAFCGHVATKQLDEARACGCDVVTTNGAITNSFETVILKVLEQT